MKKARDWLINLSLIFTSIALVLGLAELAVPYLQHEPGRLHYNQLHFGMISYSRKDPFFQLRNQKNPNVYRIGVIGDSFTEGISEVSKPFPKALEDVLIQDYGFQSIEVLNIGGLGRNTLDYYVFMKTHLESFELDFVVFLFTSNDSEFQRWNFSPFYYCENATQKHKYLFELLRRSRLAYYIYDQVIGYPQAAQITPNSFYGKCIELASRSIDKYLEDQSLPAFSIYFYGFVDRRGYCNVREESDQGARENFENWHKRDYLYLNEKIPCLEDGYKSYYASDNYHFNDYGVKVMATKAAESLAPTIKDEIAKKRK